MFTLGIFIETIGLCNEPQTILCYYMMKIYEIKEGNSSGTFPPVFSPFFQKVTSGKGISAVLLLSPTFLYLLKGSLVFLWSLLGFRHTVAATLEGNFCECGTKCAPFSLYAAVVSTLCKDFRGSLALGVLLPVTAH